MADEAPSELEEPQTQLYLTIEALRNDSVFQNAFDVCKLKLENALLEWQREQCKVLKGNHEEIGKRVEMSEQMFDLLDGLYNKNFKKEQFKRQTRPRLNNQHG